MRRTQAGRFAGGRPTTLVRDTSATGGPSTAISATAYGTTVLRGGDAGYINTPGPKMAARDAPNTLITSAVEESSAKEDLREAKSRGGCTSCTDKGLECRVNAENTSVGKCEQCMDSGVACSLVGA